LLSPFEPVFAMGMKCSKVPEFILYDPNPSCLSHKHHSGRFKGKTYLGWANLTGISISDPWQSSTENHMAHGAKSITAMMNIFDVLMRALN
jgi:hypothetical protein